MTGWASHTVVDLRAECKKRDLPIKGLKAELVARLEQADKVQETGSATAGGEAVPPLVPPQHTPLRKSSRSTNSVVTPASGSKVNVAATPPARRGSPAGIKSEADSPVPATPTLRSSRTNIASAPAADVSTVAVTPARSAAKATKEEAAQSTSATNLASTEDSIAVSNLNLASAPEAAVEAATQEIKPTDSGALPEMDVDTQIEPVIPLYPAKSDASPSGEIQEMDLDARVARIIANGHPADDPAVLSSSKRKVAEGDQATPETPAKKAKGAEDVARLGAPMESPSKHTTDPSDDRHSEAAHKPGELSILGAATRGRAAGLGLEIHSFKAAPTVAAQPAPAPIDVENIRTNGDHSLARATSNASLLTAPSTASFADQAVGVPGSTVWIKNFTRPLTISAVKQLLSQFGNLENFWMDKIKSNCYVTYDTVDGAAAAIQHCHGLKFPVETGRLLVCEFVKREQADEAIAAAQASKAPPLTNIPPGPHSAFQHDRFGVPGGGGRRISSGLVPPLTAVAGPAMRGRLVQPSAGLQQQQEQQQQEPLYSPPPLPRHAIPSETAFKKTKVHPPIYYRPRTQAEMQGRPPLRDFEERQAPRGAPMLEAVAGDEKEAKKQEQHDAKPGDLDQPGAAVQVASGGS
ncbi:hypothetical protein HDU86_001081 [Geranomyces michiganensis]|nr:hypothetical protein HDU86_001081 [Geranomyces michiganensis]